MVGQGSAVVGQAAWVGVKFLGDELEGAGDAGAVGSVQSDRDGGGGVVDLAGEVEQVPQDRAILVRVDQVGVEVLGEPRFGVGGSCQPC